MRKVTDEQRPQWTDASDHIGSPHGTSPVADWNEGPIDARHMSPGYSNVFYPLGGWNSGDPQATEIPGVADDAIE